MVIICLLCALKCWFSIVQNGIFCSAQKKKIIDDNIMDCKLLKNNNCQLFHIKYKIQILSMPLWWNYTLNLKFFIALSTLLLSF